MGKKIKYKKRIIYVQIKRFKHTCTKTAFELKVWIFVIIVRIQGQREDRHPPKPPRRRTQAPLKACPETFRWELENLTTLVFNKLGCVLFSHN